MEECEALCDRLGIMQDGRLLCIGPPSHLKSRFGKGYQLEVTLKLKPASDRQVEEAGDNEKDVQRFRHFIEERFQGATLVENIGRHMRWLIPHKASSLGQLFKLMEDERVRAVDIFISC